MPNYRAELLAGLLLALLTVTAYSQVYRNDFIDLDDGAYVTANPDVQGGVTARGLRWAWTTLHAGYWHPLTWMSLQLDAQLYGSHAGGFHVTSLAWHTATVVLLFVTLHFLTGAYWRSVFVAALFAIHPQHVESVAWVAERKDVLSTFFWVLTLLAYGYYAERPGWERYALVIGAFVCGMLAKPMLVTLPCVLLLLDYWPLRRFGRNEGETAPRFAPAPLSWLLLEKLPLFMLVSVASLITLRAQKQVGAVLTLEMVPLSLRLGNSLLAYVQYLGQTFWPFGLTVFYQHPFHQLTLLHAQAAGLLLAVVTATSLREARRRPYFVVGWLWFLGTLVPVIGLVQAGEQARADRFTYVPHIGLFIALAWGAADLLGRVPRALIAVLASVVLAACAVLTALQVRHWRDSITLWEHTLRVDDSNPRAHANLGNLLMQRGEANAATRHLGRAVELDPNVAEYRLLLAMLRVQEQDLEGAEEQLSEVVRRQPDRPEAQFQLGVVRLLLGKTADATRPLAVAAHLAPGAIWELNHTGEAQADQGKWPEAERCFEAAVQLDPATADFRFNLALALHERGRKDEAELEFTEGLRLAPGWPKAAARTAWKLATAADGSSENAKAALRLARQASQATGEKDPDLLDVLAAAQANAGQFDTAIRTAVRAAVLARAEGQSDTVDVIEGRLRLYRQGQPFRENP